MFRIVVLPMFVLIAQPALGQNLFLSVSDDTGTQLGGLTFADADIVEYDADADLAEIFFFEETISPNADVNALHRFDDGSILLSTRLSGRTLGSFTFNDGDLVRYYPGTFNAEFYFITEDLFGSNADIDAASVNADGDIFLSTTEPNTLGGLSFTPGDVIAYDPNTATASPAIRESMLFDDGTGDVVAIHAMEDGTFLLSFADDTEMIGGVLYANGDVIHYDPVGDIATLYFAETLFTDGVNAHDVDAVYLSPPPPPASLGWTLFLSDNNNAGNLLGGIEFTDGDVVTYSIDDDQAALFFAESSITPSADVDAFHLFPDGSFLLSTLFNGRTLGGLTFNDGDLVRYDPLTDVAEIFFISEALFGASSDISAVSIDRQGRILLSTREDNTLGGVSYLDGDLLAYDPDTGLAEIVLSESMIFDDGDGDINSIHALADGSYLLSFTSTTEEISGLQFNDGDVVRYDPASDSATLVFSETLYTDGSTSHEIDAVYLPPAGDCNASGAVDLDDFTAGVACMVGPESDSPVGCACYDLDRDGDNDLEDFAIFSQAFGE